MPRRSTSALALLGLLLTANAAQARPAHRQALADYFGPFLAKRLNDCRTCHLPDKPGAKPDDKPHNAFGARLRAVRAELRKAGKKTDLVARLQAIADEDSDGDGVPNLVELLAGHNPGDAADTPSAAGVARAQQTLAAFRKAKSGYAWAPFELVKRPAVPRVKDAAWVRNPIDAFLRAEHEKLGLRPRPEAPRHILLRRASLDLIGLPPSPAEVRAFVEDRSAQAYEKVVDRLLASPRYGERWGRHWMDIWRYSDWAGYGAEVRDSQPHVWRWRDWILASLNADKGYDRMVLEMLAGDELAPSDPDVLRATGFLVRNWYKFNRNVWLDRTVEHTGKAFLGVTLNCARCHDHMFDPFSQQEYYRFRAFFEPHDIRTDRVPGQPDTRKDGLVRAYDARPKTPTFLFVRGDEKQPDTKHPLTPGVPSCLGGAELRIVPVKVPANMIWPIPGAGTSTGRRLALARWIASKENPLTARVAVNHVWLRHFGAPLVPTVFDFGRNGRSPTHPALLDWLAAEFMERGWSLKHLHRLLVTSSAYRMDSRHDATSAALDPDNRLLWRMNTRRMEAEVVRDSVLHVAGSLDQTLGGPELDHRQGLTVWRRSLYFRHAPEKQVEFLTVFDAANVTECYRRSESVVPQQALAMANSSLVQAQARLLARALAKMQGARDAAAFVRAGFEHVLGRPPTGHELHLCEQFLKEQITLFSDRKRLTAFVSGPLSTVPPAADPALRARENLIHVLLNHTDFLTIR